MSKLRYAKNCAQINCPTKYSNWNAYIDTIILVLKWGSRHTFILNENRAHSTGSYQNEFTQCAPRIHRKGSKQQGNSTNVVKSPISEKNPVTFYLFPGNKKIVSMIRNKNFDYWSFGKMKNRGVVVIRISATGSHFCISYCSKR